jgi:hypothetical protein
MMKPTDSRYLRAAWAGWIVLFLVAAAVVVAGSGRSVVPAYRSAALN